MAFGLKHKVDDVKLTYVNKMLAEALSLIDIVDKTLQSRNKTLLAMNAINRVRNELEVMRSTHDVEYVDTMTSGVVNKTRSSRDQSRPPSSLEDFIVEAPLSATPAAPTQELRRLLIKFLHRLKSEFAKRFDEQDIAVLYSNTVNKFLLAIL